VVGFVFDVEEFGRVHGCSQSGWYGGGVMAR
jgi:hypothetical protein